MGALAGIYDRQWRGERASEGSAADVAANRLLSRLSRGLAQIGPDGETVEPCGATTLLLRRLDAGSTYGDSSARRHHVTVTWNGRLDNADELQRQLAAGSAPRATAAELVAEFYLAVGIDAVSRLVGDFSLALWDGDQRRLLLATDVFGLRPLFFHADRDRVIWSSRARALLEAAHLAPELDDFGVAAFLTFIDADRHTVLRHVSLLPPAHLMVLTPGAEPRIERYWSPVPKQRLQIRGDGEAEECFRGVFERAVGDRLPAAGLTSAPAYADLSGGLDSSSIVCVADQITARHSASSAVAQPVETVSWVYDRAGSSDERSFISRVEEQRGRQGLHLRDEEHPVLARVPSTLRPDLPSGQLPFFRRYQALAEHMAGKGARVLLRGSGGDHVLWGEVKAAFELADLLVQGRPARMWRAARRWARELREPVAKTLWQGAIWPLLPRRLRRNTAFLHQLDGWFQPEFVGRIDLEDRLLGREQAGFRQPSQRIHWSLIEGVGRYVGWELPLEHGCVEARFPFLDRRLVELAMALPTEQKLRPGETRSILRRSLRGVLPEEIRTRRCKAGPDEAIYRALVREAAWLEELFKDSQVAAHGYIRASALRRAVASARHGVMLSSPQLLRVLSLEVWLQSLADGGSDEAGHDHEFQFPASSKARAGRDAEARYVSDPSTTAA